MTLEQKIGQLFLVSVPGTRLSAETKAHLKQYCLGNYIFFCVNLTDYQSIRAFSDALQQTAREISGLPAFISTDQEGGMVARAFSGATHFPSAMAVSAAGATDGEVAQMGAMVGRELKALGINLNHAPVLDVNNNPLNPIIGIRSFGSEPEAVARVAGAYIRGLQSEGVMANGKHFPGHGDTHLDSHLALPTVPHDRARLDAVELYPFRAAIAPETGLDSVMTAHIIFRAIDPEVPATLSPKVLTDLMRKELGFEGMIVTDCMTMAAIRAKYGMENGCVMALNAGADLLCLNADADTQGRCVQAVIEAVQSGALPMEKIDTAVARIRKYKEKYAAAVAPAPIEVYPDHEKAADTLSANSITLVKGEAVPLRGSNTFVVSPPPVRTNIADDTIITLVTFAEQAGRALGCPFAVTSINPGEAEIADIVVQCTSCDTVLFASYSAGQNPGQVALFNALKQAGKKIVLVSLRVPYDILLMQSADTYIAAYEYTNRSVKHVIAALAGEAGFPGALPVGVL